jgi:hypothetical protein
VCAPKAHKSLYFHHVHAAVKMIEILLPHRGKTLRGDLPPPKL